jgi:hypothetical protein
MIHEGVGLVARLQDGAKTTPIEPREKQDAHGHRSSESHEDWCGFPQRKTPGGAHCKERVQGESRNQNSIARFRHNRIGQRDAAAHQQPGVPFGAVPDEQEQ